MATTTTINPARYVTLPIAEIDRNPDQPRQHFDPAALEELAKSIETHGVLQPIVVRPVHNRYTLIAGERRWRAAQLASLTDIPARVLDEIAELEAFVLSVSENVNRKDMTVMEEARAYAKLVNAGKTTAEVAELFGKTESYVKWRMDLLGLIDDCSDMVARGQMSLTLAYYLAALTPAGQQMASSKHARGEFTTEREAIDFARALRMREQQQVAFFEEMGEPETPEQQADRGRARRKTVKQVDRLLALSDALTELSQATPEELAAALSGQVGVYADRVELVANRALNARRTMRKAKAAASVAGINEKGE